MSEACDEGLCSSIEVALMECLSFKTVSYINYELLI